MCTSTAGDACTTSNKLPRAVVSVGALDACILIPVADVSTLIPEKVATPLLTVTLQLPVQDAGPDSGDGIELVLMLTTVVESPVTVLPTRHAPPPPAGVRMLHRRHAQAHWVR